ncbi:MAG: hypothetical protein FJX23_05645 [Alphaproteobacteria bacterium]|nr:hypothetical protein [Alphaproteobacteria bacterium]
MTIRKLILLATASILGVSACATPQVAEKVGPQNYEQDCARLAKEIQEAERLRVAAREEDKFMWRYAFVANAFVSAYRINKAEGAAEDRAADLKRIAAEKNCPLPNLQNNLPPAGAPIVQGNQPALQPQTAKKPVIEAPKAQIPAPATKAPAAPVAKESY